MSPSPNIDTGESGEIPKSDGKVKKTLHELAASTVEDMSGTYRYKEAELLARLKNDPSGLSSETREMMRGTYNEDPSGYIDISETDISGSSRISDESLRHMYRRILITLQEGQDSLENTVFSICKKGIFSEKTAEGRTMREKLHTWIATKDEQAIRYLLKSKSKLEKMLRRECFGSGLDEMLMNETEASLFEELGIKMENLSLSEKNVLEKITGHGEYFNVQDARVVIQWINHADLPSAKKKEIQEKFLKRYLTEISLSDLIKHGIIDEKKAKEGVKKQISAWMHDDDYFTSGSDGEMKERKSWLDKSWKRLAEMVKVPAEDVWDKGDLVSKLFEHGNAGRETLLERRLQEEMNGDLEERSASRFEDSEFNGSIDPNDWHGSFKKALQNLKSPNGMGKVTGSEYLLPGSVLEYKYRDGHSEFFRVDAVEVDTPGVIPGKMMSDENGDKIPLHQKGMKLTNLTRDGGIAPPGYSGTTENRGYSKIMSDMKDDAIDGITINSASDFEARKTDTSRKDHIKTQFTTEDTLTTLVALESALGFSLKKDHLYTTDKIDGSVSHFRVTDIRENTGEVIVNDGNADYRVSFVKFAELQKELGFKEGKQFSSVDDLVSLAKELDGLKDLGYEGGKLVTIHEEIDTAHEGAKPKRTTKPISQFVNTEGEVIEVDSIGNDGITFHYGKVKDWDEAKEKGPKIKLKGGSQSESLLTFFADLAGGGFRPYFHKTEADMVDPDAELPHMHGYPLAKFFQGMSFNDMKRAFEIHKHAIEHKLEKNSKFNAAMFADRRLSWITPQTFKGQLKSELYQTQNEAMDGMIKMFEETMSGKEARLYIRKKIALNKDARFEEVLAGVLYLAKKTGQLYPEELSDLKESKIWFHQLTRTFGASPAKRKELYEKMARKSDKGDFAVESDIIERLLKGYEGEGYSIPPNIAPRFAGSISEGIKDQEEKGAKEVEMRANIDQMNRYAMSKLRVGEGYKALGCLNRIYGKNSGPVKLNAIPFTLVMSNMHDYLGTDFAKRLHSQAVGENIRSTHALTFGNDKNLAKTYQSMVWKAAHEIQRRKPGSNIVEDLRKIEKERQHIGHESHGGNPEDTQAKWTDSIFSFWMKYGEDIHPILQMTDPFIEIQKEKGDALASTYANRVGAIAGMQRRRDNIESTDTFGEGNWKWNHTPPMDFKNFMHFAANSINPTDKSMKQAVYDQSFAPAVLGALNALRTMPDSQFPGTPSEKRAFQKKIFSEYYITIMYYLRNKIKRTDFREDSRSSIMDQTYMQDLRKQGIILEQADFGPSDTKPAHIHIGTDEKSEMNDRVISYFDQGRIDTIFESFMNARPSLFGSSTVMRRTKQATNKVSDDTFYDDYGA